MEIEKKRYTFRKYERIGKNKEFELIFNFGKKIWYNGLLTYIYLRNDNNPVCRLGLVVSRRTEKSAVKRNKFKRRIREIFRLNKYNIKKGTDIVVVATKDVIHKKYKVLEKNFIECLKKADVWIENV